MELTGAREGRWLWLDKSALVRGPRIEGNLGEPCLCAIMRLEMLDSARSARAYKDVEIELDAFHQLRVDGETIAIALTAQRRGAQAGTFPGPAIDANASTSNRTVANRTACSPDLM